MIGLAPESGFSGNVPGWLRRRRHPRLSGTLRIRDARGHEITVPLRGRGAVLTTGGTGLTGYGEVWAVHIDPDGDATSLMICYGRTGAADSRESGLCPPGATVTLDGTDFTWHCPASTPPRPTRVPQPRSAPADHATPADTPGTGSPRPTGPATSADGETANSTAARSREAAADREAAAGRRAAATTTAADQEAGATTTASGRETDAAAAPGGQSGSTAGRESSSTTERESGSTAGRESGNVAPLAGRDAGAGRNLRAPLPRAGNSRSTAPGAREVLPGT
ncbi:hypothetical protein GCM10023107_05460 [Actinoplanes octamycinicus]|nr:hypothetical protein Aoc01nite_07060 [Actinoplanes octamycinicus]